MNEIERQREIHETLVRVDERLAGHCDRFDEHVENTGRRFGQLERTVYGSNGSPGLTSRVAVLNDQSERRKWVVPALSAAALSLLVGLAVWFVTK